MFPHEHSLVPLFSWGSTAEHPEQLGTGIYVVMRGTGYLLTAAHVVDHRESGTICVPTRAGIMSLKGGVGGNALAPNQTRQDDKIDIAYIRMDAETHANLHESFVPLDRRYFSLDGLIDPGTFCAVGGYPLTRARRTDSAYQSESYSYVGMSVDHEEYFRLGYDPEIHVIVHYRIKKTVFPEGDRANPPHPRGLSGGGIFQVALESILAANSKPRILVASMHTYLKRENYFIGTRIAGHLSLIHQRFPEDVRSFAEA